MQFGALPSAPPGNAPTRPSTKLAAPPLTPSPPSPTGPGFGHNQAWGSCGRAEALTSAGGGHSGASTAPLPPPPVALSSLPHLWPLTCLHNFLGTAPRHSGCGRQEPAQKPQSPTAPRWPPARAHQPDPPALRGSLVQPPGAPRWVSSQGRVVSPSLSPSLSPTLSPFLSLSPSPAPWGSLLAPVPVSCPRGGTAA